MVAHSALRELAKAIGCIGNPENVTNLPALHTHQSLLKGSNAVRAGGRDR